MSNKKEEIQLLKEQLAEVEKDEKLLGKEEDELLTDIRETENELKDKQTSHRNLSHKRSMNIRSAQNIIYKLQKFEAEQRAFERREKIKGIRANQPSFIDCVEEELFTLLKIMENRKQFDGLEKKLDVKQAIDSLNKIRQPDYAITHGQTNLALLFNNYERRYEERLNEVIEASLSGLERKGVGKMMNTLALQFIQHPTVESDLL